jgi:hypothetical protein
VVNAVGKKPSEAFLTDTKAQLTAKGSTLTSSMYRDLQKGYPVEADQILVTWLFARTAPKSRRRFWQPHSRISRSIKTG